MISLATCAFESFVGDNVAFLDMNDCLIFIKNVIKEESNRKFSDKQFIDNNVTVNKVINRLKNNFDKDATDIDEALLYRILRNCSQETLNRIYYKNNLFSFLSNKKINKLYRQMVLTEKLYLTPEESDTPEELRVRLNYIWDILDEYIFYNHEYVDREYRVKNKNRKVALVIDTDSMRIGA